jgi:hypothetical protein
MLVADNFTWKYTGSLHSKSLRRIASIDAAERYWVMGRLSPHCATKLCALRSCIANPGAYPLSYQVALKLGDAR